MNLLKPGRGDMLDRLTILARKIVERPERVDFAEEFKELRQNLKGLTAECALLAALNAAIWQREDAMRAWKAIPACDDIAKVRYLAEIQDLNDRRAALIAEINGVESEKLYK